eukprot:s47_g23.t1
MWLSPELATLVCNVAVWDAFPDHKALLAGLRLPSVRVNELQWRLPGHVPWDHVCQDTWNSSPSLGPLFQSNPAPVGRVGLSGVPEGLDFGSCSNSTLDFHKWSQAFETTASDCITSPVVRSDRSFFGRGQLTKPCKRRTNPPVPKSHRPGEIAQASGMLNRSVAAWYKQLRRLQSYCHAANSVRFAETFESRAALWHSVLAASGFCGSFCSWWTRRPFQHQGAPLHVPLQPPDRHCAALILEDFVQNYRRYEHWQLQQRRASCRSKMQSSTKTLFAATRKPSKPALDALEDVTAQSIEVIDTAANLVSVPLDFPVQSVSHWTLQGFPARVSKVGPHYQVSSDLLLASGQSLACHQTVTSPEVIHDRLIQLWSPRWNKHQDVPDSAWDRVCQHAAATLPSGSISLPPITIQDFRRALQSFKPQAATGPCGWTRTDLCHLTDQQVQSVIDGYHEIECGRPWPKQWCVGLIHSLQKRDCSISVNDFRPITVTSLFYRLFAGLRAGQILAQLARRAEVLQCGFMRGHQAADVWYFVGVCLEIAVCQSTPVHGLVADLVKAYNTLPRTPTFKCLEILGVPRWFLQAWQAHLAHFERFFVVRRCVSKPVLSVTGFPEGCPLACCAMTAIDCLWHWTLKIQVPRVLPISYVDNLEIVCDRLDDLSLAAESQDHLCSLLDLEIDLPRLFAWSSTPTGRRDLRGKGYKVSLGERDLGGQVVYCRQLRNRVLTDRISETLPFFKKLRMTSAPIGVKILNVCQTLFPRALHACEAVLVGASHLDRIRSGVMQALRWDRKGASPLIRLGLCNLKVDPFWYQLWHVVHMFRLQCHKNPVIRDWWSTFCQSANADSAHGPFGKLKDELHNIGLVLDAGGRLWYSENGSIAFFSCPDALLRQVLQIHFQNAVAAQVNKRKGYEDLDGFSADLTFSHDHRYTVAEQEYLMLVRDGTFFTNSALSKFDARKQSICVHCGVPDTKLHRYQDCSRYDAIRSQHLELFQLWSELPLSFKLSGLVPSNPFQGLVWEAFAHLPDKTKDFEFLPSGRVWHAFTDGTCSDPTCSEVSLAAWSVVIAGRGTVSAGPLVGEYQTILRAEITAALSAMLWAATTVGDLHLWVDNQTVVDHLRDLQKGVANVHDFEHSDLWLQIEKTLKMSLSDLYVHKVASHVDFADCTGPIEEFACRGNAMADHQAAIANQSRPAFFTSTWRRFLEYRRIWKYRVGLITAFHVHVARFDCEDGDSADSEPAAAGLVLWETVCDIGRKRPKCVIGAADPNNMCKTAFDSGIADSKSICASNSSSCASCKGEWCRLGVTKVAGGAGVVNSGSGQAASATAATNTGGFCCYRGNIFAKDMCTACEDVSQDIACANSKGCGTCGGTWCAGPRCVKAFSDTKDPCHTAYKGNVAPLNDYCAKTEERCTDCGGAWCSADDITFDDGEKFDPDATEEGLENGPKSWLVNGMDGWMDDDWVYQMSTD